MNTIPASKSRECPYCVEIISATAKVCPRCRQWLSVWSLRNPAVSASLAAAAMMLVCIILGSALIRAISRSVNPPPFYTEYSNALQVLESRMNWIETTDGSRIFITGLMTNHSPIAWRNIEFECRFFNAAGVMIDAANAAGRVTMASHDDSAFRATVIPSSGSNEYRSFRISVSTARNEKTWF